MDIRSWRAVLAPLDQPSTDGRTLLPEFVPVYDPPVWLTFGGTQPSMVLGRVHAVEAKSGLVVAWGTLRDGGGVADRMSNGELIPTFELDRLVVHTNADGMTQVSAGRLRHVIAAQADASCWPGVARFEIGPFE